jgi:hypothetical protein
MFLGDINSSLIGEICQEVSRVEKQLGVHRTQKKNKEIDGGILFY